MRVILTIASETIAENARAVAQLRRWLGPRLSSMPLGEVGADLARCHVVRALSLELPDEIQLGPLQVELPESFFITGDGAGIMCLLCGSTSYNRGDVEKLYCARCKVFHRDIPQGEL